MSYERLQNFGPCTHLSKGGACKEIGPRCSQDLCPVCCLKIHEYWPGHMMADGKRNSTMTIREEVEKLYTPPFHSMWSTSEQRYMRYDSTGRVVAERHWAFALPAPHRIETCPEPSPEPKEPVLGASVELDNTDNSFLPLADTSRTYAVKSAFPVKYIP